MSEPICPYCVAVDAPDLKAVRIGAAIMWCPQCGAIAKHDGDTWKWPSQEPAPHPHRSSESGKATGTGGVRRGLGEA